MRHLHNILGIFLVIVLVVIIIENIKRYIKRKTINKIEKTIENYDYKNNTTKKKFKTTNANEFNKMVLTNSNGDLSSISCPK